MKNIVSLYIQFLKDFRVATLPQFVEKFYVRMSRARFEGILRSYGLRPSQHNERWVLAALRCFSPSTVNAYDETQRDDPSSSPLKVQPQDSKSLTPEQVQGLRDTVITIEYRLLEEFDQDKRELLVRRKDQIQRRIDRYEFSLLNS